MNHPKYMEKIYAFIFLCLGSIFFIMGLLCFIGIVKPTIHSYVQDPIQMGAIFSVVGLAFIVLQAIFRMISNARQALDISLCSNGNKLVGTIDKVYFQKNIKYGKQSPYRIYYTYSFQGIVYHHKSRLIWHKPNVNTGDSLMVYANEFGKSTVQF